jgi:hypothetical protein
VIKQKKMKANTKELTEMGMVVSLVKSMQERQARVMGVANGSLLVVIQVEAAGNKGRH